MCPNKVQNILIISTPHDENAKTYVKVRKIHTKLGVFEVSAYVAATEGTCKGAIRNIDLSLDDTTLTRLIVNPRNPTVREVRRIKSTQVVVIIFDGMRVPNTTVWRRPRSVLAIQAAGGRMLRMWTSGSLSRRLL